MSAERIVETTLSAKTKDQTVKEEKTQHVSLAWLVADTSAVGLDDPVADAGVTGGDPCA